MSVRCRKFLPGGGPLPRLAARQVRRRHRIPVIRATGAPQNRSSADSRECAGLRQPLPLPWIVLLRVPVDSAPGQIVRVSRIGSPPCSCNADRNTVWIAPNARHWHGASSSTLIVLSGRRDLN